MSNHKISDVMYFKEIRILNPGVQQLNGNRENLGFVHS